jgi:hypothetical protein
MALAELKLCMQVFNPKTGVDALVVAPISQAYI